MRLIPIAISGSINFRIKQFCTYACDYNRGHGRIVFPNEINQRLRSLL